MDNLILIATLVAATLPLVISIFSAFSPQTRVTDIEGYFLYDRELDIDSFLKTTIGYSLQVASIALFFYWTFTYGAAGPIVVCVAWSVGYLLMAAALRSGRFDDFLGTSRRDAATSAETIHGFIGARMPPRLAVCKRWAILIVSLASVIGLGGTMMAEIDYSTGFYLSALRVPSTAPDALRLTIELGILVFTVLYVLWGGYKSAVFTDRFQTPIAYVSFAAFGFGAAMTAGTPGGGKGVSWIVLAMVALFTFLLIRRQRLLAGYRAADTWNRLTSKLTFFPIVLFGLVVLAYFGNKGTYWSLADLKSILFPSTDSFLGFGAWGTIALVFANGIWQFIDISSLQRLQSLNKNEVEKRKDSVIRTLQVTGIEAGIGWFLIILTAAILKGIGLTSDNFIETLFSANHAIPLLVPIFIFSITVYMLSTISGFISALSYISFSDIVPQLIGHSDAGYSLPQKLHSARFTTVFGIGAIFVLYILLRLMVPGDAIAGVLYAIYAFQITIMPSALVAIFAKKKLVNPLASIASVVCGIITAYYTATNPGAWNGFAVIGMTADSWQVIPPLASAAAATLIYAVVSVVTAPVLKLATRK
jgi:Na+/proline symporter